MHDKTFFVFLKYKQEGATFSRSLCFYKLLYMLDEMERSSITSTIAAGSSICLTIPDAVCTVLCS